MKKILAFALLALASFPVEARAQASIEQGYFLMYSLQFDAADRNFVDMEKRDAANPLIPASRAANLLFRELNRMNILQTALFRDNSTFTALYSPQPDADARAHFDLLLDRASGLADARLARQPRDTDALFTKTLVDGLRADYCSLIEHRNMAALSYTRSATRWANRLLAVAPDYYDAYLATGISAYIIGSLPAPVRWMVRLGGFSGDKERGVRELTLTAEHGRLLAPFARILLAVVSLREHDKERAGVLLAGLARDFPGNPLFGSELRRLRR